MPHTFSTNMIRYLAAIALQIFSYHALAQELRLYVLDCGEVLTRDVSLFNPSMEKGKAMVMANPCYLIQQGKERLLWDTGLNDELANNQDGIDILEGAFHFSFTKTLASQLQTIQVLPEQVDFIAFSHMHNDHTGNTRLFSNATWLIQKAEYDFAHSEHAQNAGYQPLDYTNITPKKVITLDGDYDVFGDGSVKIISTPGHTPGHQSLLIQLPNSGPILLSGDLYHFKANREEYGIPVWNDKKATIHSFVKIDQILNQTKAQLWIQHDKDTFDSLKKAPQFYD